MVLYDNQADAASMENHSDRKEVQEALKQAAAVRNVTSKHCHRKRYTMHCACQTNSATRVSSTQFSVWVLLMEMVPPMIGIAVVMLILAVNCVYAYGK